MERHETELLVVRAQLGDRETVVAEVEPDLSDNSSLSRHSSRPFF